MSKHPFDLLMELKTRDIRLDCAALHLGRDTYPNLNVVHYLQRLDRLAEEVACERPGLSSVLRYHALQHVLVQRHGFRGNHADLYDPQNCYLHRVLDTRIGLPITLSTVWIEVARRLKWPVRGVALPGHFVVRIDDPERFILVDTFHDGRTLSVADCRAIVRKRFGEELPFRRSFLKPVSARGILARLLRNLRNAYVAANDLPALTRTLQRLAAAEPVNSRHWQDLAAVYCQRGDVHSACAHLALYLAQAPQGEDAELVRDNLRRLQAALASLN